MLADGRGLSADFELPDPTMENITACGKNRRIGVYRVAAEYFEVATRKVRALSKSAAMIQLGPGRAEVCMLFSVLLSFSVSAKCATVPGTGACSACT